MWCTSTTREVTLPPPGTLWGFSRDNRAGARNSSGEPSSGGQAAGGIDLPAAIREAGRRRRGDVVAANPPAAVCVQADTVQGSGLGGDLPALHAVSDLEGCGRCRRQPTEPSSQGPNRRRDVGIWGARGATEKALGG